MIAGHAGQCRSLQISPRGRRALGATEVTHGAARDEWRLTLTGACQEVPWAMAMPLTLPR